MTSVRESVLSASEAAERAEIAVQASPVLRHLASDQRRQLIGAGTLQRFADGAEFSFGDASVILLVDGRCEVRNPGGTVRLEAPALGTDLAALVGAAGGAEMRAIDNVLAIVIDRARIVEAIRSSARAGQELTELVADRLCAPGAAALAGRFSIEGTMGEGGSGRVLRARHPLLGIPIAIKMLSHALVQSPGGPEAFIHEASLLVQLDHAGIVRVLDAFEALGTFFMVMPWIEGATLRAHIDGGTPFSQEQILRVADEGLSALTALHAAGLVHRDVKPSNLVINSSGRLVLIDLGIACPRGTMVGRQLVGSPPYASPEQILGRPVDGRSDVYSLGCTLYELVFGRPPFAADDIDAAIEGHLRGTLALDGPSRVAMGEPFRRWLGRCLLRTRANRPTAAVARAELRHLLPTSVAEPTEWRERAALAFPVLRETVEWRVRT